MLTMNVPSSKSARSDAMPGGLAGWVASAWQNVRAAQAPKQRQMRLVETLSLGGKRQLLLVECAGEHFLVAAGGDSIGAMTRVQAASAGTVEPC